jgi:hypothetical protein
MKREFFAALLLLALASVAQAQTPATKTSQLAWDQQAPSLADAVAYEYAVYVDGGVRQVIGPTTCQGTASPFVCQANVPALTPGDHSLTVTASDVVSIAGQPQESPKSDPPFLVRLIFAPQPPKNLRITVK